MSSWKCESIETSAFYPQECCFSIPWGQRKPKVEEIWCVKMTLSQAILASNVGVYARTLLTTGTPGCASGFRGGCVRVGFGRVLAFSGI